MYEQDECAIIGTPFDSLEMSNSHHSDVQTTLQTQVKDQRYRRIRDRNEKPTMAQLVYEQLILQRLQRGYQIVLLDKVRSLIRIY